MKRRGAEVSIGERVGSSTRPSGDDGNVAAISGRARRLLPFRWGDPKDEVGAYAAGFLGERGSMVAGWGRWQHVDNPALPAFAATCAPT